MFNTNSKKYNFKLYQYCRINNLEIILEVLAIFNNLNKRELEF